MTIHHKIANVLCWIRLVCKEDGGRAWKVWNATILPIHEKTERKKEQKKYEWITSFSSLQNYYLPINKSTKWKHCHLHIDGDKLGHEQRQWKFQGAD